MNDPDFFLGTDSTVLCGLLLALMLLASVIGFTVGRLRHSEDDTNGATVQIESALFGLLGLLLAFTFAAAASRNETRKELMVDASNAIGTVYLRTFLYEPQTGSTLRVHLKDYLDQRIAYYEVRSDIAAIRQVLAKTDQLQNQLWGQVMQASRQQEHYLASMQMIPAMNEMFDLASSRLSYDRTHIPDILLIVLTIQALAAAFANGYNSSKSRHFNFFASIGFALLTVMVVYLILDLDRPRRGILNLDVQQQLFTELRSKMDADAKLALPFLKPQ
ncbi:hypothetical protein GBN32_13605 [Plesiomonas shigelloides]|uniref:bestrophin-like domain n=1 Tax=Plesiomonas shigelloides TaxID=703 RepID=UPI001262871D|nr:hypothetical protein [Plesiomonas shigelloides]KAB7708537.1 hypothetical protein GBN32_13605 [Plesiomonas shigelloides]